MAIVRRSDLAAARIELDINTHLRYDIKAYDKFFSSHKNQFFTDVADLVNNAYIVSSGDENGTASYGQVSIYLVNWYLTEYNTEEEAPEFLFDPYDETQVDLSGIVNAVIPQP